MINEKKDKNKQNKEIYIQSGKIDKMETIPIFNIKNNEIREEKQNENDQSTLSVTNSINNIEETYFSEKSSKFNEIKNLPFQMEEQNKNILRKMSNIYGICLIFLLDQISELYKEISSIDIQIYNKVKDNNLSDDSKINKKYNEKPIYKIPIEKIEEEINNKINKIKNNINNKKGLNFNVNNKINNGLFINKENYINSITKPLGFNKNFNNIIYNPINYNSYNQYFSKIIEQKNIFLKYKEIGLYALMNPNNLNHNLFTLYINTNVNANPFIPFNNNINYFFNNYINPNNLLAQNYFYSKNLNNLNNLNNIIHLNNIINPKQYTITFKSKTNNPNIDKISKIQVTTSYIKDVPKKKEENEPPKNEKNIINLEDIESGKETRRVVRLNPIPPNYSSFDTSKLLDKYLEIESGKKQRIYNALYTPLCKIIGKNLGYTFVMMAKPKYVIEFYKTFYGRSFGKKKCKKPCNIIWADKQGDDFLKTSEDDPIRKPIIFKDIKED